MTRTIAGDAARAALVGVLLVLAGCRQADGQRPVPTDEQPNKIHDVGRDLQNLAGGQADAAADLLADLRGLDADPPPEKLTQEVQAALQDALAGKSLADAEAQQLANFLFTAATGRELSTRQILKVGEDVKALLLKVGASEAAAQRASAAITAVGSAATRNAKRWYHVGT